MPVLGVAQEVSLTVQLGTVFALLGPNGAGKTTTVQILSTLIHPDGGQATLAGYDLNTEPAILARLEDHGIGVAELTVHSPDLDDVFLTMTGN